MVDMLREIRFEMSQSDEPLFIRGRNDGELTVIVAYSDSEIYILYLSQS